MIRAHLRCDDKTPREQDFEAELRDPVENRVSVLPRGSEFKSMAERLLV